MPRSKVCVCVFADIGMFEFSEFELLIIDLPCFCLILGCLNFLMCFFEDLGMFKLSKMKFPRLLGISLIQN